MIDMLSMSILYNSLEQNKVKSTLSKYKEICLLIIQWGVLIILKDEGFFFYWFFRN